MKHKRGSADPWEELRLPPTVLWVFALYALVVSVVFYYVRMHAGYDMVDLAVAVVAAFLFWRMNLRPHVRHLVRVDAPLRDRIFGQMGIVGGITVVLLFIALVLSVTFELLRRAAT